MKGYSTGNLNANVYLAKSVSLRYSPSLEEEYMNAQTFFRYCGELVAVRWRFSIGVHRELRLQRAFFMADVEDLPPVRPIVAVAVEVCGLNIERFGAGDVWQSADKLNLNEEFVRIVEAASLGCYDLHQRVRDVREELIVSLSRGGLNRIVSCEDIGHSGARPRTDDESREDWWKNE